MNECFSSSFHVPQKVDTLMNHYNHRILHCMPHIHGFQYALCTQPTLFICKPPPPPCVAYGTPEYIPLVCSNYLIGLWNFQPIYQIQKVQAQTFQISLCIPASIILALSSLLNAKKYRLSPVHYHNSRSTPMYSSLTIYLRTPTPGLL